MLEKFKNLILILMFIILFWWCIITNSKYSSLKQDCELLKQNKEFVIDSLNKENQRIKAETSLFEKEIDSLETQIEDLKCKIKTIQKEEFTISTNFSEATLLLKKNLSCTDL